MSTSIYKIDYECDCGVYYGSCGVVCSIILRSHNSVDVYSFYHSDRHEPVQKTVLGLPTHFGDNFMVAMKELINHPEKYEGGEKLTDQESEVVFKY